MSAFATRSLSNLSKNALTRSSIPATPRTFSSVLPRNVLRSAVWNSTSPFFSHRSFSGSAIVKSGSGATDLRLTQKLQEEIKFEKDAAEKEQDPPEFLKAFLAENLWKIETQPGSDEVALTRTFGQEHIRVMFTIADLDAMGEDNFLPEDGEEGSEANEEGAEEDDIPPSQPIRVSITITKDGAQGALSLDATCQDGLFVTDNVAFYSDAKLACDLTAEADWKRRGMYMGPRFDNLDINVQEEFENYLRERGISEGLALFIPEYAEYKEQKEYVKWLENVKKFIEG